jgi:hypothetical protein
VTYSQTFLSVTLALLCISNDLFYYYCFTLDGRGIERIGMQLRLPLRRFTSLLRLSSAERYLPSRVVFFFFACLVISLRVGAGKTCPWKVLAVTAAFDLPW